MSPWTRPARRSRRPAIRRWRAWRPTAPTTRVTWPPIAPACASAGFSYMGGLEGPPKPPLRSGRPGGAVAALEFTAGGDDAGEEDDRASPDGEAAGQGADDASRGVRPRGDRARTGGQAWRALDQAGDRHRPVQGAAGRREAEA